MKKSRLSCYYLGLMVGLLVGVGGTGLSGQAASHNQTVTFGQLTNQNPHRLAAIRAAARQTLLTKTHAKASRVPAVFAVKLPTHMTKKATLTAKGLRMNLLPNAFNVRQIVIPYNQLSGKILNRYLPKKNRPVILKAKKVVALTFDDGPDPTLTPRLLKTLARNHVHATFFEVGQSVSRYPKVTRAVVKAGNEVGNHSWNHPDFNRIGTVASVQQVIRTDRAIYAATGKLPQYVRPPYGNITAAEGRQIQHPIIRWSVDSRDWAYLNTQKDISEVLRTTHPGSIILMHDIHAQSVAAVPTIIKRLKAKGYRFVTVSQLLNNQALPGLQYFAANNYRTAGK
ncbi:polysaccharide deacetylase family protein [Lactiplantibacillus daowaiensis]|uniref:Polysaccharide deacetylase family protein n=1 Tax=Lactiplantibacillus daowaiensis TaxID=2559918 RepID=A0ABW1S016_9LACO|nr:polysaccharide deacetylase family protein [Lactiplantibacillus daowaiensis]